MIIASKPSALLALEDGSIFYGHSFGAEVSTVGELVFNTSMTGYQEIITDPSYADQIINFTYPHIGNTGITPEDVESTPIWSKGVVVRRYDDFKTQWRADNTLSSLLKENNIPGISGVDTRAITLKLREQGALKACIQAASSFDKLDEQAAIQQAKGFAGLSGLDLAQVVSHKESLNWQEGVWQYGKAANQSTKSYKVVAYDFGVKENILRMLAEQGADITLVPAKTPAEEVLKMNPDGIFLSNGPGDPEPCDYAIEAIKVFLDKKIPLFGICLGVQLLSLAAGAKTKKMAYGHHGANHPIKCHDSNIVYITSQNHGFMVDPDTLPSNMRITHTSLFDGTVQGVELTDRPAFGFQGHPEASPGPHEVSVLFEKFSQMIQQNKQAS